MADISDVETALVELLQTNFGAGAALWGGGVMSARVFRGRPQQFSVSADRLKNIVDIAVVPLASPIEVTTRWLGAQFTVSAPAGVQVSVTGQTALFTGSANAGDLIGCLVAGKPYSYLARGGESAALIAANLCQLIRVDNSCTLSGDTLSLPLGQTLQALCYGAGRVLTELARQKQPIEMTIWCPSAATRDVVASAVTACLDGLSFLQLSDGSCARLRYQGTSIDDGDAPASFYLRKLIYTAEYSAFSVVDNGTMLFASMTYNQISLID